MATPGVSNTYLKRVHYTSLEPPLSTGTTLGMTTKGDLLSHNGTDAARLPVGSNTFVLQADAAQTLGVKWAAKSPLTATGDMWVYQNSGGVFDTRLPVGTDTQVLTADSGAIKGVSYKYVTQFTTRANGHLYSLSSRTSGSQSINSGATTAVTFTTTSGEAASPATRTGMYLFTFGVKYQTGTTGQQNVNLRINGSVINPGVNRTGVTGEQMQCGTRYVPVNSGDTIELVTLQGSGGAMNVIEAWLEWVFIGGQ
jgi:hypothetical protein